MRILSVDLQPTGISAVEIETAFGRFEIRELHEVKFDTTQASQEIQINPYGAAQGLIQSLAKTPDRLVFSLPSESITFRNIQVASKDRKTIQSALEYELEDELPFESDLIHYDYALLKSQGQSSTLHVEAVKKSTLQDMIDQLKSFHVDPDCITSETWALRSIFSKIYGKEGSPEPILLIGIEQNRSYFYVHDGNQPILFREILFGTKAVERNLEITLGAGASESHKWVNDIGLSGAEEQISHLVSEGFQPLITEIRQTELQVQALLKKQITSIHVTGSGCLIPGFFSWLEMMTHRSVGLFRPLSSVSPQPLNYSDLSEVQYCKALGLALSLISGDKISPLNFRKKEFSKSSQEQHPALQIFKQVAPYAALVFGVFLFTQAVELKYYEQKLTDMDDQLKRSVKNYYGGIADSAAKTYLSSPSKLKSNIEADLTKERELSKLLTPNTQSPLLFLKALSQKIGKDIVVDLLKFDVGSNASAPFQENTPSSATLQFKVTNPQQLERLKDIIEKNYGLKASPSEEIVTKGAKGYLVTFTGTLSGGQR